MNFLKLNEWVLFGEYHPISMGLHADFWQSQLGEDWIVKVYSEARNYQRDNGRNDMRLIYHDTENHFINDYTFKGNIMGNQ